MTTTHDTPASRARALAAAIAEQHGIEDLTSFINQPADEQDALALSVAVFDSMYRASEELAIEFDCDVELLRRDVPIFRFGGNGYHAVEHFLLRSAAMLADRTATPDEERARDLMRRAFMHHYMPTAPQGWAHRHVQRALELLDDEEAVTWARTSTCEVLTRWGAEDGFDYVQVDIDQVRATLEAYLPKATSMF